MVGVGVGMGVGVRGWGGCGCGDRGGCGGRGPRAKQEFNELFAQARVHCDNKLGQIGLSHDYNMSFSILPRDC